MVNKPAFGPEKQFDADELARISAALVAAIAEARTVANHGPLGAEFRELLQHAREMHDLLVAQLQNVGPAGSEYARGLAKSIGNHLDELQATLKRELN